MNKTIMRARDRYRILRQKYLSPFIFIHINKTAGSSIERALGIPLEHKTVREKIDELGYETWCQKFTFTVVRNPWDKVASHYFYRVKTNQTGLGNNPIPFGEWVRRAYGEQDPILYDSPKMFMPQVEWLLDDQDNIAVDEILRFENLDSDFRRLMLKLCLDARLPHIKRSGQQEYSAWYDKKTWSIVAEHFSSDIEYFGYSKSERNQR